MKCVKIVETKGIYRVSNQEAEKLVNQKKAIYVSKEIWKLEGRKYKNNLNIEETVAILDVGNSNNCTLNMQESSQ